MSSAAAYAKTRAEVIALFGWDGGALTPEQVLRADCATALRFGLDALQGALVRGESVDLTKMLTASEALSKLLPAAVLAAPPTERREDPRAALLALILQQRERAGIPAEGVMRATIRAQRAEIKQLRAQLGGQALEDFDDDDDDDDEPTAITPSEADIVPQGETADRDRGMRPGPDDPKPPVIIEATAGPAAPAKPAKPFVNGLSDVPRHVRDTRPANEPWRRFTRIDWQG